MHINVYTYTNKGGKQKNEDYLDYNLEGDKGVFLLADGLGGHPGGELASQLVVTTLLSDLKNEAMINCDYLRHAFLEANKTLLEHQENLNMGSMKTTAVALCLNENNAIWGHLGDSRLYYISDNEINEVTRDHSVTYKKYLMGEIIYHDVNTDDDRFSLLGSFGNRGKCNPQILETPKQLKSGDAFLLCSDGFWEYVYDEEILIDFLKAETPKEWTQFMLLRHIKRTKPSNDNYSLITIFVE